MKDTMYFTYYAYYVFYFEFDFSYQLSKRNQTLEIRAVRYDDEGSYTCTVTKGNQHENHTTHISVARKSIQLYYDE